ncbi:MAG: hypothetical protein D8M59_06355 [Planctomycetes bacterium]|nr:hypothetical protein [Planctomycetota bacterium]NOG55120.1 hypothetical protein [Planctomycetota bacterium]
MPANTSHAFITDFEASQYVEGIYTIRNGQLGLTRSGKPYLKALIGDRSGQIPARMWNVTEQVFDSIPRDGFVLIEAQTQPYQGEIQLIIQNIQPATDVTDDDLRQLIPTTERDIDQMFDELTALLGTLEHPAICGLVNAYLDDEDLMTSFRRAPAAVSMHHAYLGGLLEHTLQLCSLADGMLPRYPMLSRDLVLTGLFLHDMAKCRELKYDAGFSYTDEGQLLGHLVMGSLWLEEKAAEAQAMSGHALPREALMCLHHILISHHGQPEYGAARVPSTAEAVFISRLDELDAKTQMAIDHTKRGRPDTSGEGEAAATDIAPKSPSAAAGIGDTVSSEAGDFSDRVWALGTRLYRPDPLRGGAAGSQPVDAPESQNGFRD